MTTITVMSYSPNGDGLFYKVRIDGQDAYTPFEDAKDARAAAFIEACKASLNGPVRVEEVGN